MARVFWAALGVEHRHHDAAFFHGAYFLKYIPGMRAYLCRGAARNKIARPLNRKCQLFLLRLVRVRRLARAPVQPLAP